MVIFFRLRDNVIDRRLFLARTIAHKITVCVIICFMQTSAFQSVSCYEN